MRRVNYVWPRFIHLIRNANGMYFTINLFGRRLHIATGRYAIGEEGLWQ